MRAPEGEKTGKTTAERIAEIVRRAAEEAPRPVPPASAPPPPRPFVEADRDGEG